VQEEAIPLWREINSAIANNQLGVIQRTTTDKLCSMLKPEFRANEKRLGNKHVKWFADLTSARFKAARFIQIEQINAKFAQLTVLFDSQQVCFDSIRFDSLVVSLINAFWLGWLLLLHDSESKSMMVRSSSVARRSPSTLSSTGYSSDHSASRRDAGVSAIDTRPRRQNRRLQTLPQAYRPSTRD